MIDDEGGLSLGSGLGSTAHYEAMSDWLPEGFGMTRIMNIWMFSKNKYLYHKLLRSSTNDAFLEFANDDDNDSLKKIHANLFGMCWRTKLGVIKSDKKFYKMMNVTIK